MNDDDTVTQRDVVDVEQMPPLSVSDQAGAAPARKSKVQMVLLQRKAPAREGENVPHLLEIHCNCDWNLRRCDSRFDL